MYMTAQQDGIMACVVTLPYTTSILRSKIQGVVDTLFGSRNMNDSFMFLCPLLYTIVDTLFDVTQTSSRIPLCPLPLIVHTTSYKEHIRVYVPLDPYDCPPRGQSYKI